MDWSLAVGAASLSIGATGLYYARRARLQHNVENSQRKFRAVRESLNMHRPELARLAFYIHNYPDFRLSGISGAHLLCSPEWIPAAPIALSQCKLLWMDRFENEVMGDLARSTHRNIPFLEYKRKFRQYTDAIESLARPKLFDNRPGYRLVAADWTAGDGPALTFTFGNYFDMIDLTESLAHELMLACWDFKDDLFMAEPPMRRLPIRRLFLKDPLAMTKRHILVSINTLTLKRMRDGSASFFLHRRDPASVVVAGGQLHIVPAGGFQPSTYSPLGFREDLNFWHSIMREYSEEFLGNPEATGAYGMYIDHTREEPFASLQKARRLGRVRLWYLGFGLDPLTLCGEILTLAVFDASTFDSIFRSMVTINLEGILVTGARAPTGVAGIPFTKPYIDTIIQTGMAPAAEACLKIAWNNRDRVLAGPANRG